MSFQSAAMRRSQSESPGNGVKRSLHTSVDNGPPQKKMKALLDDDDPSDSDASSSSHARGVTLNGTGSASAEGALKINEDYAKRFEYNKKREELGRLQEKYGPSAVPTHKRDRLETGEREDNGLDPSSESEEDDDGVLALGALDAQVQDTLEAIRKKDPRVYDVNAKFYTDLDDEQEDVSGSRTKQQKPLFLSDYHRKNLLEGPTTTGNHEEAPPTYAQEQDNLKNSIVKEMHATTVGARGDEGSDGSDKDDFLIEKARKVQGQAESKNPPEKRVTVDVESADKDPETYLSNFISAKAWVPSDGSRFQPFESDDEDEDRQAEEFEVAYNLRFEDPKASNEKLMSHARDAAAKYSVRKETVNPRQKARDAERARKDAEKQLRSEEKARLRKLKVADLEDKIQKIKDAAGLNGSSLPEKDWSDFLNDAWDDDRWDREMKKRFGDDYYENIGSIGGDDIEGSNKRKTKKPKWNDDIDINDLVPDFDAAEDSQEPPFELTDEGENGDESGPRMKSIKKPRLKEERDKKKGLRLERRKIETLVDEQLDVDETLLTFGKKHAGIFRYRDTSPIAHGLTAHDILMADDSQLNHFAGLKKLAAFRDPDKKRKDKKHLGKKARVRQWRKDTFGNEQGPQKTLAELLAGQNGGDVRAASNVGEDGIRAGERKKRRGRKAETAGLVA